jgi:hypothetical protein
MKRTFLFCFSFLLLFAGISLGENAKEVGKITFRSSDTELNEAFEWSKKQALAYAFENDAVGYWYEAALPGREAFCMRDVAHQSMGAHVLGLTQHTKNMLLKFAENISESKDWCSYWEINRDGLPAPVDYVDDVQFWYNLPANFDVLDCCYRMYLWSGDRDYLEHPALLNFYKRSVHEYVERWDLDLDRIMTRERIMNTRGRIDPNNRFQTNRGIPSYDEGGTDFVVALDQLAVQHAGYLAYARIQQHRGNRGEAEEFMNKASAVRTFVNDEWWDGKKKRYYSHLDIERRLVHRGPGRSVLYYGADGGGEQTKSILDGIVSESTSMGVEALSHVPEVLYRYGREEPAYRVLLDLTLHERREYPEVSFALVGAFVSGVMGIELEGHPPSEARTWGGYVDRFLKTLPGLTDKTSWAELQNLSIRANALSVRHEGVGKTILTNNSGPSFLWKARFSGSFDTLLVNGEAIQATKEELYVGGPEISWVRITVGAGETMTARIPQ